MAAWPVGEPQRAIGLRLDETFPTASTFKIPLLYALYQMVDRGEVNLDERVEIEERHRVPGSGVLQDLDLGLRPTIRDLSILMTVVSDNQATDMLYAIVGEQRINAAVAALGLRSIETPIDCRALLYDYVGMDIHNPEHTYAMFHERARAGEYNRAGKAFSDQPGSGNDLTSPRDMAALCEAIEQGVGLSAAAREAVIDTMKRQKSTERIPAGLPENTVVAHKTGSIKGVRNDAGIVYAKAGPYVIALYGKGLENEKLGVDALAELSRAAWDAFGDEAPA
jgi:beta-lactamase class A